MRARNSDTAMHVRMLQQAIKEIVPEDWHKEIPGVAEHSIATVPYSPGQMNVSNVFLDVTFLDDEGKVSEKSRTCTAGFCVLRHWLALRLEDQKALIGRQFRECMEELKAFVRDGKDVPIGMTAEEWKVRRVG